MEPGPYIGGYRAPNPCLSSDDLARAENRDLPLLSADELIWEWKRLLDALDIYREQWRPYRIYLGSLPGVPFDVWARVRIGRIGQMLQTIST